MLRGVVKIPKAERGKPRRPIEHRRGGASGLGGRYGEGIGFVVHAFGEIRGADTLRQSRDVHGRRGVPSDQRLQHAISQIGFIGVNVGIDLFLHRARRV